MIPSDIENAAPTGTVRSTQGSQSSRLGELNKRPAPWTQSPRTKSASLLTQALATNYELDEHSTSSSDPLNQSPVSYTSLAGSSPPKRQQHYGPTESGAQGQGQSSIGNMPLLASTSTGGARSAIGHGDTPSLILAECGLRDLKNFDSLEATHRNCLGRARGRGTSLERTKKEKRTPELSGDQYHLTPGDTVMADLTDPSGPAPSDSLTNHPPMDGVRAQYRSWRGLQPGVAAEKAWSIGDNENDERHSGHVEKSIKEALTGVEPNSRSRKASHSMGFFKEGLPHDTRTKDNRGRTKEMVSGSKLSVQHEERLDTQNDDNGASRENLNSLDVLPDGARNIIDVATKISGGAALSFSDSWDCIEHSFTKDALLRVDPFLNDQKKRLNLSSGTSTGNLFPRSLLPSESDRAKAESDAPPREDDQPSPKLVSNGNAEEDEDSGEEQISSALFLPHQKAQEYADRPIDGLESGPQANKVVDLDSEQWLEEHFISPPDEQEVHCGQGLRSPPISALPASAESYRKSFVTDHISPIYSPGTLDIADSQDEREYGSVVTDKIQDEDITPTGSFKNVTPIAEAINKQIPDPSPAPKKPLDAIELIPYRHQVGGHTTLWRFSKRAVCKQLNNRENEFYEKIEQNHPKLLKFLPRYIGVLNVTFEKQNRRKPSRKDTSDSAIEHPTTEPEHPVARNTGLITESPSATGQTLKNAPSQQRRKFSLSVDSGQQQPVPTVTFADNRHIIPTSILKPRPLLHEDRTYSDSFALATVLSPGHGRCVTNTEPPRPSESEPNPWGKTHVNKLLRDDVFKEVFLQRPIPIRHKKPAEHRTLPSRKCQGLRSSNSESNLQAAQQSQSPLDPVDFLRKQVMTSPGNQIGELMTPVSPDDPPASDEKPEGLNIEDETGRSAPEPKIARSEASTGGKRQRRYSSGGLRRRPTEVADDRGQLKYFEEADDANYKAEAGNFKYFEEADDVDYKAEAEGVFSMDSEPVRKTTFMSKTVPVSGAANDSESPLKSSTSAEKDFSKCEDISQTLLLPILEAPRPVNPKEARAQPGSRVEYFLLLEDLTAGMKRPCIMDLKMGTRQHGVDANEKKQKSQRTKCASTTSKELGVRVCGLQVWDVKCQEYIFEDKYFGRNLKTGPDFQKALTRFLYDGVDYSSVLRHIPTIIDKLLELEDHIQGLIGYRFYGTSLLMFYDGATDDECESDSTTAGRDDRSASRDIDFKIADFANCVTKDDFMGVDRACPPRHAHLPDKGFLRGLKSLRRYFLAIQREIHTEKGYTYSHNGQIGLGPHSVDDLDEEEGNVSY